MALLDLQLDVLVHRHQLVIAARLAGLDDEATAALVRAAAARLAAERAGTDTERHAGDGKETP